MLNPQNDLALANILRAPFYGFSDSQLFEISLLDGKYLIDKLTGNDSYTKEFKLLHNHIKLANHFLCFDFQHYFLCFEFKIL